MNKKELKKLMKPIVEECIREVLLQEGVLSTIISEVVQGTSGIVREQQTPAKPQRRLESDEEAMKRMQERKAKHQNQRKMLLDAVGADAYGGVDLFEGTTPAPAQQEKGKGALAGVAPNDPGVDISAFASSGMWKKLAGN